MDNIKDCYFPSICGIGYIGEGKYSKKSHRKIHIKWDNMLSRCYDKNTQENQPSYKKCSVDIKWYNFQNFAEWYEEYYREGFHLDKDLLFKGNKIYSPETCVFVPPVINTQFAKRNKMRGIYPIGVSYDKKRGKFQASCRVNGKQKNLGRFDIPKDAFQSYKVAKEKEIKRLTKLHRDEITEACYWALMNYIVEETD